MINNSKQTKRILVIDDDLCFSAIISIALQRENYEVLCQSSLKAINEIIRAFDPNIIMLDIMFGDENGLDYIPSIKNLFPGLSIIVVSSFTEGYLSQAKELIYGIDAYISKPTRLADLIFICNKYSSVESRNQLSIRFAKYTLNCREKNLIKENGEIVGLTSLEYKLLSLLVINKNKVITRNDIETHLYGTCGLKEYSINNLINSLRKHFVNEKHINIATMRCIGYKLIID